MYYFCIVLIMQNSACIRSEIAHITLKVCSHYFVKVDKETTTLRLRYIKSGQSLLL